MVLIKVQFDAYNRQFKLVDSGVIQHLDDGETYVLIADPPPSEEGESAPGHA